MTVQVSARHKVVGVPLTPQLQNLFPKATTARLNGSGELILIPHGFQETIMLRNLGLDVPAPILSQYSWPGDKRPFRVQKLTAAGMTTNQRFYVLNDMGTGKTKAAIWAYDYLRGLGLASKLLVVAPLSTLDNVWRREIFRTCPHLSVGVLHASSKKRRIDVLNESHDVYVINTDGIKVILKELLARKDIDTLVLDELAMFRGASSDRNEAARKLAERMVWAWGMTGSPAPTDPTDAWGQCRILTPHTVPAAYGRFRDETMYKTTSFKYVPRRDAIAKVFKAMQPAVRYMLDDVVELPAVIERTIDVKMGKKQEFAYEQLRKHACVAIQNHQVSAVNAGVLLNKLLQVSLGYVYTSAGKIVGLDNNVRLDAIVETVEGASHKVLVFVPFIHALQGIYKRLADDRISCAMVHGETPKKARDTIFNLFQNTDKYKAIVAHPACMSHGLTLTAATTVIWAGPMTSLETFEQANARVRRIGQSHKQQIIMFQGSAMEKKMYASLRAKQSIQNKILDMFYNDTNTP
jgi:SNF2 family DNA or RNA helicase